MKNYCLLLICTLCSCMANAQAIDNSLSYKNMGGDNYFRINYENDLFSGTDIYYTQGINLELAAPWVSQFPLSKLLLHPHWGYQCYSMALEHDAYTPTYLGSNAILYGDRPFAACLFLKTSVTAIDDTKHQRWSTTLSTGVIGPAAGGQQMQMAIHRAIGDIIPQGWNNQISNDVVLNYQADYEKQLLSAGHFLSLDADGMGRVGTLSDKAAGGITLMAGYFNDPFTHQAAGSHQLRAYVYDHPEIDVVGYDATMQGGLFDRSPYTISATNVSRVVAGNRAGVVLSYGRVYAEYFQSYLSSEFRTGNYHVWGGVQVAFGL